MKRFSKLLALVLALVMALALAACGSNGGAAATTAAPETEAQGGGEDATEAESQEETEEETEKEPAQVLSADEAVAGVSTTGFVAADGAKVSALIVKYNVDLTGADVSLDKFDVEDYGMYPSPLANQTVEKGQNPGVPLRVYVNDKPEVSENGGSGTGNYVIIEVNTDYQFSSAMRYQMSMLGGVQQTGVLTADNVIITPASEKVVNYMPVGHELRYGYRPLPGRDLF